MFDDILGPREEKPVLNKKPTMKIDLSNNSNSKGSSSSTGGGSTSVSPPIKPKPTVPQNPDSVSSPSSKNDHDLTDDELDDLFGGKSDEDKWDVGGICTDEGDCDDCEEDCDDCDSGC